MDFSAEGTRRWCGLHAEEETGMQIGKASHRHTPEQLKVLEEYFKKYSHPDKHLKLHLSQILGLEPRQIQYWFQNKRTQLKIEKERENHNALKAEQEKNQMENLEVKEALKYYPICQACYDKEFSEEMHQNSRLKKELNRLYERLYPNAMGGGGSSFSAEETAPKEMIKFL